MRAYGDLPYSSYVDWDEAVDLARRRVAQEQLDERKRRVAASAAEEQIRARLAEISAFLHRVNRELARQGFPGGYERQEPRKHLFDRPKPTRHVRISIPGLTASYPIGWGDSRECDLQIHFASDESPRLGSGGYCNAPSHPQLIDDVQFWHTDEAITVDAVCRAVAEWCVREDVHLSLA